MGDGNLGRIRMWREEGGLDRVTGHGERIFGGGLSMVIGGF